MCVCIYFTDAPISKRLFCPRHPHGINEQNLLLVVDVCMCAGDDDSDDLKTSDCIEITSPILSSFHRTKSIIIASPLQFHLNFVNDMQQDGYGCMEEYNEQNSSTFNALGVNIREKGK